MKTQNQGSLETGPLGENGLYLPLISVLAVLPTRMPHPFSWPSGKNLSYSSQKHSNSEATTPLETMFSLLPTIILSFQLLFFLITQV